MTKKVYEQECFSPSESYPIKCQCCPHTETSQLICCAMALNGLNWQVSTKNLVVFKTWDRVKDEKL